MSDSTRIRGSSFTSFFGLCRITSSYRQSADYRPVGISAGFFAGFELCYLAGFKSKSAGLLFVFFVFFVAFFWGGGGGRGEEGGGGRGAWGGFMFMLGSSKCLHT